MDTFQFLMAGAPVLFSVGVLVGSGLHTRGIDRRYRDVARLVRYLNESGVVMDGKPAKYRANPTHNQAATRYDDDVRIFRTAEKAVSGTGLR